MNELRNFVTWMHFIAGEQRNIFLDYLSEYHKKGIFVERKLFIYN